MSSGFKMQGARTELRFAGLHLSGPNANKTALVVLAGEPGSTPLHIVKVYEKIGPFGSLFSDERLVDILVHEGPFAEAFIDCPLSVPPCVACTRPVCPGAMQCEDVTVAYMLSLAAKKKRRGARKARPVNPQSQRLWDIVEQDRQELRLEPSYSANLAPLVTRAQTLQRRLNSLSPQLRLKETSIDATLAIVHKTLRLPADIRRGYRNFERGLVCRREIVKRLAQDGWIIGSDSDLAALGQSVEGFHALLCAWIGGLHVAGLTRRRPEEFVAGEGWVYLPEISLTR